MADAKPLWQKLLDRVGDVASPLTSIAIAIVLFAWIFSTKLGTWLTNQLFAGWAAAGAAGEAALEKFHELLKLARPPLLSLAIGTIGGTVFLLLGWYKIGAIFTALSGLVGLGLLAVVRGTMVPLVQAITWKGIGGRVALALTWVIAALAAGPIGLLCLNMYLWLVPLVLPGQLVTGLLLVGAIAALDGAIRFLMAAPDYPISRSFLYRSSRWVAYGLAGAVVLYGAFDAAKANQLGRPAKWAAMYVERTFSRLDKTGEATRTQIQDESLLWESKVARDISVCVVVSSDGSCSIYSAGGDTSLTVFFANERVRVVTDPEHARAQNFTKLGEESVWKSASQIIGEGEPIRAVALYDFQERMARTAKLGLPGPYVFVPATALTETPDSPGKGQVFELPVLALSATVDGRPVSASTPVEDTTAAKQDDGSYLLTYDARSTALRIPLELKPGDYVDIEYVAGTVGANRQQNGAPDPRMDGVYTEDVGPWGYGFQPQTDATWAQLRKIKLIANAPYCCLLWGTKPSSSAMTPAFEFGSEIGSRDVAVGSKYLYFAINEIWTGRAVGNERLTLAEQSGRRVGSFTVRITVVRDGVAEGGDSDDV